MPIKSKVYMDSCCFIELALESIGKHDTDRDNDLWFLKELLNAARDEQIEVLTSTLSIAADPPVEKAENSKDGDK